MTMNTQRNDIRVQTEDGLDLAVRVVRDDVASDASAPPTTPLILVHGARAAGVASFDLPVPGGSLAADLAALLGSSVYVVDLRGYGRSSRPSAMDAPAEHHPPQARSHEVMRDLHAIVTEVLRREPDATGVALLGWATGGQWAAAYAALWPERVSHLVLLNSLYGASSGHAMFGPGSSMDDPTHPGRFHRASIGAWRLSTGASMLGNWESNIPGDLDARRDPLVAQALAAEVIAADPEAEQRDPVAFKHPSGALEDSYYLANGRQLWDAAAIEAHTLIVRGGRDFWSRAVDVDDLVRHLHHARSVDTLVLPDATHHLHLERAEFGRQQLLDAVRALLRRD